MRPESAENNGLRDEEGKRWQVGAESSRRREVQPMATWERLKDQERGNRGGE
jgi:hypothetical protein